MLKVKCQGHRGQKTSHPLGRGPIAAFSRERYLGARSSTSSMPVGKSAHAV